MSKILLAGATGYLGGYILEELLSKGIDTRIVVRNKVKISKPLIDKNQLEIIEAELTNPASIENCCKGIDTVITTLGITKQKDGLTYMDVDYQANINLLEEAKRNGIKKFIYISIFKGEELTHLKICEAKEKFVIALKKSGLEYCVVRPTGYFSDMGEFFKMAKKGKIYLFCKGTHQINPIDGKELAKVCIDAIQSKENKIPVGGPDVFTYKQIAELAFSVAGIKTKLGNIPDWVRKMILLLLRTFTSSKFYGPIEFFMTVLSMDLVAPK